MYRSVSFFFLCQITALSWRSSTHCFQYAVFWGRGDPNVGRRRTSCRNPNAPSPLPPVLHSTDVKVKSGECLLCVCVCVAVSGKCSVSSDLNQEKGESVSMHTVASHMAYWEAFFSLLFSRVSKCFKCFIKYNKNAKYDLLFIFNHSHCHKWCFEKKGKKKNFKNRVLVEDTILTVQKSSTFHCLDHNCVRRCNNKSSGFYLFTNRIWLYCCTVFFSFGWRGRGCSSEVPDLM